MKKHAVCYPNSPACLKRSLLLLLCLTVIGISCVVVWGPFRAVADEVGYPDYRNEWKPSMVFAFLGRQNMTSLDSNGGPASTMRIRGDGSFTGYYQGYENGGYCISFFSGSFSPEIEWTSKTTGYLTITEFSVRDRAGATGVTPWGEKYTCSSGPFHVGERLFMTLPGTTFTDDIPAEIKRQIYWVYDPYDNYIRYFTLNKLEGNMCWWLIADTDYRDMSAIETFGTGEQGTTTAGNEPVFSREKNKPHTFWKEGKPTDYEWGPDLFSGKSQAFNYDLALAAGVLSWAVEDPLPDDIDEAFGEIGITDGKYCCYYYDREKGNNLRYTIWKTKDDDSAFAIGRMILSVDAKDDTTLIVVVGRGTQKGHNRETLGADWLRKGDGPEEIAGVKVLRSISSFEEAMWQSLGDFIGLYPITTPKVKFLITGHSLGGAMANCLAARVTDEIKNNGWMKKKATQDDVYVYTFGAIKVLTEDKNAEEGFENIHNIYNFHDTFGPYGGMHGLDVGSFRMKFGHTDLYSLQYDEGFLETKNHEMPNYLSAVRRKMFTCENSK